MGEKGEVAGFGPLDAGHAPDVDLAVAFQPASQSVGNLTKLHRM